MNDLPLVSICIPTFNAGAYWETCLQSAVSQTYQPLEILICDDGSTDGTIETVKNWQQKHPQIRLLQNPTNIGMVSNWNRCIEEARGPWIKFLFQDDWLEPACVETMLAACLRQDVQVGLCRRDFILHDDVLPHVRQFFHTLSKPEAVFKDTRLIRPEQLAEKVQLHLVQNFLGEPTCFLFHKDLCRQSGFFKTDLKQMVDYEFIVRLGLVKGLAFVPETMAHFRVHGQSESSANNQLNQEARRRSIAAELGDSLVLLHHYLCQPAFEKVKQVTGAQVLEDYMKHLYYSGCKHHGEKLVNQALEKIRAAYPEIGALRYNFFQYVRYRRRMKKWFRQLKNTGGMPA